MQFTELLGDTGLRLAAFLGVLAAMALIELAIPKRKLSRPRSQRWPANLAIVVLDSLLVRLMAALAIPLAAVAAALWAESQGWGLLNWTGLPAWLEFALALVVLDFALWLQHLASHKLPLLWRVHRMHHSDVDIDVTTAIRFHPIEIALSMLWKMAWVVALGVPAGAVLAFEVVLNAMAMFNHANLALPARLDAILRPLVVTPDMHRIHHSTLRHEHDTNYGFNLSLWDRLFGTYTDAPEKGHAGMRIGLENYQSDEPTKLLWSLKLPFRR